MKFFSLIYFIVNIINIFIKKARERDRNTETAIERQIETKIQYLIKIIQQLIKIKFKKISIEFYLF